jgi:hypothetical protein
MMYQHASNWRFARFERFLALHSVFVSVNQAFGEVSYHQQGLLHKICMPWIFLLWVGKFVTEVITMKISRFNSRWTSIAPGYGERVGFIDVSLLSECAIISRRFHTSNCSTSTPSHYFWPWYIIGSLLRTSQFESKRLSMQSARLMSDIIISGCLLRRVWWKARYSI